jgi:anti-anti-sigma factor
MQAPPEFDERVADDFQQSPTRTFSVRAVATDERDLDTAVFDVHGDIDIGTAGMLREALLPALGRGTGAVVVDLSEVAFMDSTGVHVLLDTLQRLKAQNRRLALACREHGQVHKVLALLGLLDAVAVHRSRLDAVIGGDDRIAPPPTELRARRRFANRRPTPQFPRTSPRVCGG